MCITLLLHDPTLTHAEQALIHCLALIPPLTTAVVPVESKRCNVAASKCVVAQLKQGLDMLAD